MSTWEDVRAAALPLPGAEEVFWSGQPLFRVGTKGFVQSWRGRVIMKLDRGRQELLFEVRPEVFAPYRAGGLRWSYVDLARLDPQEVADLVVEAWTQVVPKKISRPWLAQLSSRHSPLPPSAARRGRG